MRRLSLCKRNIILCGSMAVVLCGCAAVTKDELQTMIEESETISLEIAEPLDVDRLGTKENESETGEETSSEGLLEGETESVRDKSVEEWMEDIEAMGRYTVEELESIEEDAKVYEAYGSSPEQAVNMALADAVNGKTNGSVDMTFTLPVVVDENGVPYPTDPSNGQPIIPENDIKYTFDDDGHGNKLIVYGEWEKAVVTTPDGVEHTVNSKEEYEEFVKGSESTNSTMKNIAQENGNVNEENVAQTAGVSKRDTLPLTKETDCNSNGWPMKVYGDNELIVVTVDGVEHEFNSVSEYRDFVDQWEFEHDEEQQQYIASEDRFSGIGTYGGYYGSEEAFLEAERNSTVHGKVQ